LEKRKETLNQTFPNMVSHWNQDFKKNSKAQVLLDSLNQDTWGWEAGVGMGLKSPAICSCVVA
jgi:hypothetical protein